MQKSTETSSLVSVLLYPNTSTVYRLLYISTKSSNLSLEDPPKPWIYRIFQLFPLRLGSLYITERDPVGHLKNFSKAEKQQHVYYYNNSLGWAEAAKQKSAVWRVCFCEAIW